MDIQERRQLNNGFGESLTRAVELAVTPTIFAGLGYLLDGAIGTRPLFMLVFFAFVITYLIWKSFRRYDSDMRAEEAKLLAPKPKDTP